MSKIMEVIKSAKAVQIAAAYAKGGKKAAIKKAYEVNQ